MKLEALITRKIIYRWGNYTMLAIINRRWESLGGVLPARSYYILQEYVMYSIAVEHLLLLLLLLVLLLCR
jgi:hypothetical protein